VHLVWVYVGGRQDDVGDCELQQGHGVKNYFKLADGAFVVLVRMVEIDFVLEFDQPFDQSNGFLLVATGIDLVLPFEHDDQIRRA
jgi:hypothetical protein